MKVLLTGGAGFLGSHVHKQLAGHGKVDVTILERPQAPVPHGARRVFCDLSVVESTTEALKKESFDIVVHMAALLRADDYAELQAVNATGTRNLLTALAGRMNRLILVSSCAVYGFPGESMLPIDEHCPVDPVSSYGTSMVAREDSAREMSGLFDFDLLILRPFNLFGPGQKPNMLAPSVARQLAMISTGGSRSTIRLGRLDTSRDMLDARDAATAIAKAVLTDRLLPEKLNLSTGRPRTGVEIVEALFKSFDIRPKVIHDRDRAGESGPVTIYGSNSLAMKSLGWEPRIPFDQTIDDIRDDWLSRLDSGPDDDEMDLV